MVALSGVDAVFVQAGTARPFENQLSIARFDPNRVPGCEPAREDVLGETVLEIALDCALERPGAVGRVVADIGQEVFGRIRDFELHVTIGEALREDTELNVDDVAQLRAVEPMEDDCLVEPIEELRSERVAQVFHDGLAHRLPHRREP